MNQDKTLTEIRKYLNVSRKAIQGYEKHGLITGSQKDKYGRHVYDEKTMERIVKIRFYQKLGFSVKEIKELIDSNSEQIKKSLIDKKEEIENKLNSFNRKREIINSLIADKTNIDIEYMLQIVKQEDL